MVKGEGDWRERASADGHGKSFAQRVESLLNVALWKSQQEYESLLRHLLGDQVDVTQSPKKACAAVVEQYSKAPRFYSPSFMLELVLLSYKNKVENEEAYKAENGRVFNSNQKSVNQRFNPYQCFKNNLGPTFVISGYEGKVNIHVPEITSHGWWIHRPELDRTYTHHTYRKNLAAGDTLTFCVNAIAGECSFRKTDNSGRDVDYPSSIYTHIDRQAIRDPMPVHRIRIEDEHGRSIPFEKTFGPVPVEICRM